MKKNHGFINQLPLRGKSGYSGIFIVFALCGLFVLSGCTHFKAIYNTANYSLDDLKTDVFEARAEILNGYRGYAGRVVKISPINGVNWADYSRSAYWDWEFEDTGFQQITMEMSVLVETQDSVSSVFTAYKPEQRAWPSPTNIKWNGPASIGWTAQCGDQYINQFGGKPAQIPVNKWVDLSFTQTIDITGTTNGQIFIDGKNTDYGLLDLTMYIRHFKITMRSSNKFIALTFNESPTDFTYVLINKLEEHGVKATFFAMGMGIEARHPIQDRLITGATIASTAEDRKETLRWIIEEGHEIANYSFSHSSVLKFPLSDDDLRKELEENQITIQKAIYGNEDYMNHPWVSKFFRSPYKEVPDANLLRVANSLNLAVVGGSGFSNPAKNAEEVANDILLSVKPWMICISGDPRSDPAIIRVLDIIIPKLKADGYIFVTLSEMADKRRQALKNGIIYDNMNPELN